jgi:putative phosphoesterase
MRTSPDLEGDAKRSQRQPVSRQSNTPQPTRIGLISDTHGLLRPEALEALRGSDHLIHAGDIGDGAILDRLAALAPVTAVRGNNDVGAWAKTLPETATLRLGGACIFVIHDLAELASHAVQSVDVVVCGHSHRPRVERTPRFLVVNPGSAGPRRFRLPVSVGRLRLAGREGCEAELVTLDLEP